MVEISNINSETPQDNIEDNQEPKEEDLKKISELIEELENTEVDDEHLKLIKDLPIRNLEQMFINETYRFKILSKNEQNSLIRKYHQSRDIKIKNKLIESNLRFVAKLAIKRKNKAVTALDLIQVGSIGLNKAVERFNPDLDVHFLTYAGYWVNKEMINEVRRYSKRIDVPVHIQQRLSRIIKLVGAYQWDFDKLGNAQIKILSNQLNLTEKQIDEALSSDVQSNSLNKVRVGREYETLEDTVADPNEQVDEFGISDLNRSQIQEILKEILDERSFTILNLRYGLEDDIPQTLDNVALIAHQRGVSLRVNPIARLAGTPVHKERVRQLEDAALSKLQNSPIFKKIKEQL